MNGVVSDGSCRCQEEVMSSPGEWSSEWWRQQVLGGQEEVLSSPGE